MDAHGQPGFSPAAPVLRIRVGESESSAKSYKFESPFLIGRDESCAVTVKHDYVSRRHAEVVYENGGWWIRDLNSANGLFREGERIQSAPVEGSLTVQLGAGGPYAWLEADRPREVVDSVAERYFGGDAGNQPMSDRTILIRRAYEKVQKKQRSKYLWIFGALGLVALASAGYAWYLHREWAQRQELARELFYSMKSTELEVARVQSLLADPANPQSRELMRGYRERERQNQKKYDDFLRASKLYSETLSAEDKLLLRVTRIFGECELTMPADYMSEVKKYIGYWKSTPKLRNILKVARERGYAPKIARAFLEQGLPPQYFYLALQESGFDAYACGPQTYKGFAKGMWQFIPETATKYGLKVGPLVDLPRPDPADERNDWEKATVAASRYIRDLYTTDAQASGLLVFACYNWGEDKVLPLVRSMPPNPRERNFWRLLRDYKDRLPKETYDYVFYIVSAAVIGEDPRMFGFDFESPLAGLDSAGLH